MIRSTIAVLALIALSNSAFAQSPPRNDAAQNVRESQQYDRSLQTSPGFRAQRIKKECGPIDDPELHASCVASFGAPAESAKRGGRRSAH